MKAASLIALLCLLPLPAHAAGKINYGSRVGMTVTVASMSGLDTANATIRTKHTRSDAIAFCREYIGKVSERCIRGEMATRLNDEITANCPAGVFTDFYGTKYQFKGENPNRAETEPKYLLIDLTSGDVADGSSASGYATNLRIFQALCPKYAPMGDDFWR